MNRHDLRHLRRVLDETTEALQQYRQSVAGRPRGEDIAVLSESAGRLARGLYLLLPPRGPSSAQDCPHCGNPVKVYLSK
jgi:hypothetical protein